MMQTTTYKLECEPVGAFVALTLSIIYWFIPTEALLLIALGILVFSLRFEKVTR